MLYKRLKAHFLLTRHNWIYALTSRVCKQKKNQNAEFGIQNSEFGIMNSYGNEKMSHLGHLTKTKPVYKCAAPITLLFIHIYLSRI